MTKHKFGGPWTRLKLAILQDYLSFFTRALGKTPFNLHYADAFAGTGNQSFEDENGQGTFFEHEDMEGSARIALNIEPPFDGYHFNDLSKEHYEALKELLTEYPGKQPITTITNLDANDFVKQFCGSLRSNDRAILFIDPYNTELNWKTLTYVARYPLDISLRAQSLPTIQHRTGAGGVMGAKLGKTGIETDRVFI